MRTLVTLAEASTKGPMLNVACSRCPRRGRYSLARLITEHGPDTPVRHAVAHVNADCPRREDQQLRDRCDIWFPE